VFGNNFGVAWPGKPGFGKAFPSSFFKPKRVFLKEGHFKKIWAKKPLGLGGVFPGGSIKLG